MPRGAPRRSSSLCLPSEDPHRHEPPARLGAVLRRERVRAIHWSSIGDPKAPDADLMVWAIVNDHIVFTHDLDFSTLLALTGERGPSVIQMRTLDVLPNTSGEVLLHVLIQHQREIEGGAIVTLDRLGSRLKILPIRRREH